MQDADALAAFLVTAHRNGYATARPTVADGGEKTLTYESGDWRYRDRYHGSTAFVGREVVFYADDPVWGMSYYGDLTTPTADRAEAYAFLRTALERATSDRPYRGPERFERDRQVYTSSVTGDLDRFRGEERIVDDGETIYRGEFAGGWIE